MPEQSSPPRPAEDRLLRLIVIFIIAVTGVALLLPLPFTGDQALFSLAGRGLRHNVGYYADLWDVKQPGIYWLYAGLGGLHDGPAVVHAFDILWCTAASILLQRGTQDWFRKPWISASTPLLVVWPYELSCGPGNATLIEPLLLLPLTACLLLGLRAARTASGTTLATAGLIAGTGAVFKLLLLPILLLASLAPIMLTQPTRRQLGAVKALGACLVPAAVPVAIAVVALRLGGASFGLLWRSTFLLPSEISHVSGLHSLYQTRQYLNFGAEVFALPTVLALIVLIEVVRVRRRRDDRDRQARSQQEVITLTLLILVLAGVVFSLPQKLNSYQVYVFLVPLGLLAAYGLDHLMTFERFAPPRARFLAWGAAVLLVAPLASLGARHVYPLLQHRFALTSSSRAAYRRAVSDQVREVDANVKAARAAHVRADRRSFYALADPVYYAAVGADRQALQYNGWSPEQMPARAWTEWSRELMANRPATLLIDSYSQPFLRAQAPEAWRFIQQHYRAAFRPVGDSDPSAATWWVTNDPGRTAPHAGPTQL